ncbi:MAG: UDP-3-O-(3-hydroxymyristoyl)glucosamine N-acyltransferase [Pseudomonadota bacterium]
MPHTIAEIADALGAEAAGDLTLTVTRPRPPLEAGPDDLALAMDKKFGTSVPESAARAAILWEGADWQAMGLEAAILVTRARWAMSGVTGLFDIAPEIAPGIHSTAVIDASAQIGADAAIGPFVVIGARAVIGDRARILPHVTVGEDAVIGADALLHPGTRIGPRVQIGNRFIAQPNAVVGADGFSFVTPEPGAVEEARTTGRITERSRADTYARINSVGAVVVGDDVEIGANSAVDRGTVTDTRIGSGTKLDNLVQVGHNVQIGETCLLCGHVGIAGSAEIGDRVILGGKAGVADHVTVGHDVIAGGGAAIASRIAPQTFVLGYPAVPKDQFLRTMMANRRLPDLLERVATLEKQVQKAGPTD